METPQETIDVIAELIKDGMTSGNMCTEDSVNTYWELHTNTWKSGDENE